MKKNEYGGTKKNNHLLKPIVISQTNVFTFVGEWKKAFRSFAISCSVHQKKSIAENGGLVQLKNRFGIDGFEDW